MFRTRKAGLQPTFNLHSLFDMSALNYLDHSWGTRGELFCAISSTLGKHLFLLRVFYKQSFGHHHLDCSSSEHWISSLIQGIVLINNILFFCGGSSWSYYKGGKYMKNNVQPFNNEQSTNWWYIRGCNILVCPQFLAHFSCWHLTSSSKQIMMCSKRMLRRYENRVSPRPSAYFDIELLNQAPRTHVSTYF